MRDQWPNHLHTYELTMYLWEYSACRENSTKYKKFEWNRSYPKILKNIRKLLVFIPWTWYIKINIIYTIYDQHDKLSQYSHVRLYVRFSVYMPTSRSVLKILILKFAHILCSPRSCSFLGITDIELLYDLFLFDKIYLWNMARIMV